MSPSADGRAQLRATGTVTLFDGFLAVYSEGPRRKRRTMPRCTPAAADTARTAEAHEVRRNSISPSRRRAIPKASLVKKLEELGIGRPSTYASILSVLRDRAYVRMGIATAFIPEDQRPHRHAFLSSFFKR